MSSSGDVIAYSFKVQGRVQGVFFRKYTKEKADKLGLVGWVRNEPDKRTVTGVIQGKQKPMEQMQHWFSNVPGEAIIQSCTFEKQRPNTGLKDFTHVKNWQRDIRTAVAFSNFRKTWLTNKGSPKSQVDDASFSEATITQNINHFDILK